MHDYLNIVSTALLVAVMVVCFAGCKAYYPTTSTTDKRDSICKVYVHDSIYVDRWRTKELKGDTVYLHDSIIRTLYQKIVQHDSVYINKCDTLYQVREVQAATKAGSTFLRNSGIALWVILSLLLLSVIAGIILKFAK